MVDLLTGLSLTFRYQAPSELVTEQYPMERPWIADRFRGVPRMSVNPETGEPLCIACELCALACPEKLIAIKSERNPVTKKKELLTFTYDTSRCMFCGLCEEACPSDALELTQDYEMAYYDRVGMILDRPKLEQGQEPTVYAR